MGVVVLLSKNPVKIKDLATIQASVKPTMGIGLLPDYRDWDSKDLNSPKDGYQPYCKLWI